MANNLKKCKTCGEEIAKNAKTCPKCGAKNKKGNPLLIGIIALIVIIIAVAAGGGNDNTTKGDNNEVDNNKVDSRESIFDGDCGIIASAEIGNNIINYPELKITITNTTDKEISAIKFYAVPQDVYGEEIKGWTTQKNLYTDTPIAAGKTTSISYQLIEQSVKTVKLYVYSVYFVDGTEWGDKNASTSKILNEAPTIDVTVNS